jgi:hypothetical protein
MSFESGNELSFGYPCRCEAVERVEGLNYFRDTLVIDTPTEQTILLSTANAQDFYSAPGVEMTYGTPITEGPVGTYKLEFYKLSNVQAAGSVTLNGGQPFPILEEDLELCNLYVDCPALIPTMGQWGIIILGMIMLIISIVIQMKKESILLKEKG